MELKKFNEKELRPTNGFVMLVIAIVGLIASTVAFIVSIISLVEGRHMVGGILITIGILGWIFFSVLLCGLKVVHPNEARIFTLFGKYYGTVKTSGFHFVNPFCVSFSPDSYAAKAEAERKAKESLMKTGNVDGATIKSLSVSKAVSLRTQTLDNGRQKVNDVLGNPITIGAIVIWRVDNPTQAVFAVENYKEYLSIQTDSTIRNVTRLYPYDVFDEEDNDNIREKTLRGSAIEIAETMKAELHKRVEGAGLVIEDVRITHLAYAEEIAAAMLQRQQAAAIIAARTKIVDGAVGMVKMAIDKLGEDEIVLLDEERKAAMVSNLLVVLCGNRDAQPIVNSGSIY